MRSTRSLAAMVAALAVFAWASSLEALPVRAQSDGTDTTVTQEDTTGFAPVRQGIVKKAHKSELKNHHTLSQDAEALKAAKKAAAARTSPAPKNAPKLPAAGASSTTGPLTSVFSNTNFQGVGAGCCSPPDSTGDVGPTHFVEMVNDAVAIYPRSGGMSASASLEAFAGFPYDCAFDPQVSYDKPAARWLYSMAVLGAQSPGACAGPFVGAVLAFGWSKTANPSDIASGWCRFYIGTGSNVADYDKLGHDNNFLTLGANLFSNLGDEATAQFLTAKLWSIRKPAHGVTSCTLPAVYSFGSPSAPLKHADGSKVFTPVPVNMTDSYGYGYVLDARDVTHGPAAKIAVWRISRSTVGKPVLYRQGDIAVAAYGVPPPVPQPGPGAPSADCSQGSCLDSLDGRLTQAIGHLDPDTGRETVWTQHAVTDGAVGPRSVERWYELIPGLMTVRQSGNISDPFQHVFNGAVSPAMAGNEAAIFYNIGNEGSAAAWAVQTRNKLTRLGTFQNPVFLQAGTSDDDFTCGASANPPNAAPCRWGDYSAARPDPQGTNAVWGVGMYTMFNRSLGTGGAPGWASWVTAVTPGCSTAAVSGGLDHRNVFSFQASSEGCAAAQYEFWLRYPNGTWYLKQGFSPSSTFTWDSTGAPAGSYSLHVWANQVGDSTASFEAMGELNFTLSAPVPCDSGAIGPLSPSLPAGSVFSFVASSGGCQAPMFAYWYQPPGGSWKLGRGFNEDPTWDFDTTGFKPGVYNVRVWVNEQGDQTTTAETSADAVATLTGCDGATVTPATVSQPRGGTVSLHVDSTGCPDPQYEFWLGMPNGTWVLKRGWGGPDYDWSTAGLAPGTYTFHVWANQQGAYMGSYEIFGVSTITLS